MVMSETEVTISISNIKIIEAQRKAEQTPSEPTLPPQPSGNYDVDESVRACEVKMSSVSTGWINNYQLFLYPGPNSYIRRTMAGQYGAKPQSSLSSCLREKRRVTFSRLNYLAMARHAMTDASLSGCYVRCYRKAYVRARI